MIHLKKYYSKGDLVATRIINENGETEDITNLPLGKYVIKEENIPDSYYQAQARIARERGYGDIEITEEINKSNNILNKNLDNNLDIDNLPYYQKIIDGFSFSFKPDKKLYNVFPSNEIFPIENMEFACKNDKYKIYLDVLKYTYIL